MSQKCVRQGCKAWAIRGGTVCNKHGGAAPQVRAAAQRRLREAEANALMLTLGEPVPGDPAEIIAERIAARNGHVRWLYARVQALEPEALTWGMTRRKTAVARDASREADEKTEGRTFAGTDEGDTYEAKPSIWYALYVEAADKLEKLCIEAMRVGLLERQVRLDERMADMWVRVIDGMLVDLGHDPNAPETAAIVARHLELVA